MMDFERIDNNIPKISVLVPIYNTEKYLKKCLDSIAGQTLKDIEVICVNDGSTDNSLAVAEEFAEKDPRFKVINKENTGYGNTMNIALEKASGEYIGIVESDDFAASDMFEYLYSLSRSGTIDLVKGNFYDYYEDYNKPPRAYENKERNMIPDSMVPFILSENAQIQFGHPSVWSAVYRREFINDNNIRFKEEKGGGWVDNPFFYETLCKAKSIIWTKRPLYYYRKSNPNSSSNLQIDPTVPFDRMNDNLDILEENGYNDLPNKRCAYARAIMYANGAVKDFDYDKSCGIIDECAKKLMRRLDSETISSDFSLKEQLDYFTYASPLRSIVSKTPKVLIYNWLPFDNPWGWGGGVTVYCKNIISEILKSNPNINIYFLSSGFAYNSNTTKIFYRKINNIFGDKVKQYEIVNSPVPAEQRNLYVNPLVALENKRLKKVFKQFMEDYGPFDAVHFNNIEGLSFDVLDLKEDFPDTKFIYSLHNYVPLCVNGSYYMRHKHCNCNPKHTGVDCFKCTRADIRSNLAVETYKRGLFGLDPKDCISQNRWIKSFGFERLDEDVSTDEILDFAKTATQKINKNCDDILAVSKRVYEIAAENGFDENKMSVSYIGTLVASKQVGHATAEVSDGLKIVFLGSDINFEEKGYAFLLDTLSKMDIKYASKIDLLLTVRQAEHAEIYTMLKNFRSLNVVQGYTHDDLEWIFKGAHLSIVPVLWEDNLPQIAIESVAFGVPVLTSTAGGAKELCDSELFRFECADSDDMLKKIMHFVDYPEDLKEYWNHHHGLVTMKQHWEELSKVYGISCEGTVTLTTEDLNFLIKENNFLRAHLTLNERNFTPNTVLEDLRRKLNESNEQNEKLKREMEEMQKISGKIIFESEYDPIQGKVGATMFKLTLDEFDFSDFYAEIKFIRINNVTPSTSDILRISGTLLNIQDNNILTLHQIDWQNGESSVSDQIYYRIEGNSIYFIAQYTEIYSGFIWQIETLTSRAAHETVKYEALNNALVFENEIIPEGAFNNI